MNSLISLTLSVIHICILIVVDISGRRGRPIASRRASVKHRLSAYRNFAASGQYFGIRRPCGTQTAGVSRLTEVQWEEGTRAGGGGGRTRRLAIFRVHSVAKPQLTALLGSYSSSRPLASSLPYLLLLFRSPFPSRSSSLPFLFITIPSASSTVRPPLVLLRLYDLPSLLLHALLYCITHVLSLFFPPHFSFVFFYGFFFLQDV